MKINIKCPKCNHEFDEEIEHLLPQNEISEAEKNKFIEEGKKLGEIGREKDRENYRNALEKALRSQKHPTVDDEGKIAEVKLENYLKKTFPNYPTKPIKSGEAGGDIILEIKSDKEIAGSILFESKKGYSSFKSEGKNSWPDKLDKDILKANANYGIIVSTVLPAKYNETFPYIEYKNGRIFAVKSDKEQNLYAIIDLLSRQIKNDYANKQLSEKKKHNLSNEEKNALTFIETKNINLLIKMHEDIKNTENNLGTIERSHTKEINLLKIAITNKKEEFKNFYEELDLLGIDLSKVDEILEKAT